MIDLGAATPKSTLSVPTQAAGGTTGSVAVTEALAAALAVPFEQVSVKVAVPDNETVSLPVFWREPDQPPDAVQPVLLVDVHVRVTLDPLGDVDLSVVRFTVGATAVGDSAAPPPPPPPPQAARAVAKKRITAGRTRVKFAQEGRRGKANAMDERNWMCIVILR
jgi:hypothetical protein